MIVFDLHCDAGHRFEGWFGSSSDYEEQLASGLVDCPHCGSNKVEKMLMAPGVSGTRKSANADVPMTTMPQMPAEMVEKLREIKQHVEANSENVGDKFPEEARKIHYGEAEARGIYGKASLEDAVSLAEEGVEVMPIPELPEEKN